MISVNISDLKRFFSLYISLIENRDVDSIIITKYEKPIARLSSCNETESNKRIGIASGIMPAMVELDEFNEIETF